VLIPNSTTRKRADALTDLDGTPAPEHTKVGVMDVPAANNVLRLPDNAKADGLARPALGYRADAEPTLSLVQLSGIVLIPKPAD
jgi:hypothetical protein